jgi:group I intron endonuclease
MIGIYQIKNKVNGKIYIGSSVNIDKRWKYHRYYLNKNEHHNVLLQRSWNLYGESNFEFEIIEQFDDPALLLEREQHYLDTLQTTKPENGYNLCPNANSMRGYKYSEEQKQKMSELRKGQGNQHYGKKHSEETKKKIGQINSTKVRTEETKRKLAEITRERMANLKETNPEKFEAIVSNIKKARIGKPLTEQAKKKLSESAKKRVGDDSSNAKLNTEQVIEIRKAYAAGNKIGKLAKRYNVTKTTISYIVKYKSWKHIP